MGMFVDLEHGHDNCFAASSCVRLEACEHLDSSYNGSVHLS